MKKIIYFLLITSLFLSLTGSALAQEKLQMIVGPVRQEIFLNPGENDQVEIRFYNQSERPITGQLTAVDFIVTSSDGAPTLLDDPSQASPKFSGTSWISLPYDQITIAATNRVNVPVSIQVPNNAKPGGRYVAIYFQPNNNTPTSSGSGVASRIAGLLYIRVNGEITENALITRFYSPSFFEYGPITVNTEILNRGDYHITPKAVIAMSNAFGTLTDQVSLRDENIFPDATRIFTNEIGPKWLFGRYKLSLMGSYGTNGKSLEATTYVWVMPWRIIAIVILGIILIYILIKKVILSSNEQVSELESRLSKEEEELEELKKLLRKKNE
ncbi:hypothetical protein A2313_02525 [Candidatus Roizmanbacteria bacterium RIFOXYB2_FULL_41_10]|uniref:CARDB domain-containing protein n=1 Tax=Candidatus Roizmanbacteria bacterium RIFOXYA1_FULL_41_12 TaxID=1802082 RepID=A0A1F7K9X0_9BACT|nr:MAG: hypothetical protein A2209_01255 [Candidatus Roizmanbacteria bacterium RIFOXYA1_FULL_41_12]OGK66704.1 MAG: hypothetical protein A2377_02230 [Candidatus Roizmanbacteria bacterium RIFOXYB1_FULL_41_27]OGK68559.1 MAG: hypothetical protein A2262_04250 [Candidatus Roizmanbacteria bacterium RIFOXYA2_FULL_41_8]OGK70617.1 MAG: hypothetical protein A2313_02525 [Candidatus Roizmanbacteria bacterium RIFOXYB2_FULL_41_10]OGK70922.1 MAG: hypothetical protein A2403_02480 [Candidatus Roizmanbacteria bac